MSVAASAGEARQCMNLALKSDAASVVNVGDGADADCESILSIIVGRNFK
jgi:hypothetical protein